MTTSNVSIGTSAYTANTLNNLSTGIYTTSPWSQEYFVEKNGLEIFAEYILMTRTEDEIKTMLDGVKTAMTSFKSGSDEKIESDFSEIVRSFLKNRHFSEEFILYYYDDIKPSSVADLIGQKRSLLNLLFEKHKADIMSGNYSALALKLELSEDE